MPSSVPYSVGLPGLAQIEAVVDVVADAEPLPWSARYGGGSHTKP